MQYTEITQELYETTLVNMISGFEGERNREKYR